MVNYMQDNNKFGNDNFVNNVNSVLEIKFIRRSAHRNRAPDTVS
jgi:hypothetical protein